MSLEDIIKEIESKTGLSKEEIENKINEKYDELSGLVTKEGAALIVARDLGLDFIIEKKRRLQIKNIFPGMKNINVIGRIFKISPIIEFSRQDNTKGKVCNIFIADETGYFRLPLWNDQVKIFEEGLIKVGDVVQVVGGIARENIFGDIEISLGRFGNIRTIEDLNEIISLEDINKKFFSLPKERVFIKDLEVGMNCLIIGTIVKLFKGKFIFDVCPICGSSIKNKICQNHGEVDPKKAIVVSGIIDDETSSIRFVLFREIAEKLLDIKTEDLVRMSEEERYEFLKHKILGREVELTGRVKKSNISENKEIIANEVKDLNSIDMIKKLVGEIEFDLKKV